MAQTYGALLGQLILTKRKAQGLTQTQLAEDAFENSGKTRRISELENGLVANPHPATIDPIISVLGISEEELERCAEGRGKKSNLHLESVDEGAEELFSLLAQRYDADYPSSSLEDLSAFLHQKADEWRELKARLQGLEQLTDEIKDYLLDAERFLSSANFDAADKALKAAEERFHQEQALSVIETSFQLRVARGDSRLLAGEFETALSHYIAAADYFRPFDLQQTIDRLDEMAGHIYEASRRSLRPAYAVASGLLEHLIMFPGIERNKQMLAKYQYRLGLIYRNAHADQRTREPTKQLDRAIRFASTAVELSIGLDDRYKLACARISLANCLREKALLNVKERKSTLHEVIKLLDTSQHDVEKGTAEEKGILTHIHNNLGSAYELLASTSTGASHTRYKKLAFDNFKKCVQYSEEFCDADSWGGAKLNMGLLLWERSKTDSQSSSEANFLRLRALAELIAASETYPQTLFPLRAADLNYSLGGLFNDIAANTEVPDLREIYLGRALSAFLAAESVFDEQNHLSRWADIQMMLGYVFANHSKIAEPSVSNSDIEEAISRLECAAGGFQRLGKETTAEACRKVISDLTA